MCNWTLQNDFVQLCIIYRLIICLIIESETHTYLIFQLEGTLFNILIRLYIYIFVFCRKDKYLWRNFLTSMTNCPSLFKYIRQYLPTIFRQQKWTFFFFRKIMMWMFRYGWLNVMKIHTHTTMFIHAYRQHSIILQRMCYILRKQDVHRHLFNKHYDYWLVCIQHLGDQPCKHTSN